MACALNFIDDRARHNQTAWWLLATPWSTALQSWTRLWRDWEHAKMSYMLGTPWGWQLVGMLVYVTYSSARCWKNVFSTRKLWLPSMWRTFSRRALSLSIPNGPRTCLCSSHERVPMRALMSLLMMICVLGLIALSIESSVEQNWLWWGLSQEKYTEIRVSGSDFPLIIFPLVSRRSNLISRWMMRPAKSSLGSVVMGGGEPAAFQAVWNAGERMMATPLKRCCQALSAGQKIRSPNWGNVWWSLLAYIYCLHFTY